MRKWIPVLIVIAAVVASAVAYPQLPDRIPTHWSMSGQAKGWSSRFWGAWMMPLILVCTYLSMRAIPHIDPRRENYAKFQGAYEILIIAVMLLMLGAHIMVLRGATGHDISVARMMPIGIGVLFIVVGTILPGLHPNWFIGIRTPWTLSSNLSWERTHRVGGYVFAAMGAATLITAVLAPALTLKILFGTAMAGMVFLFAFSYMVWKEDPARSGA